MYENYQKIAKALLINHFTHLIHDFDKQNEFDEENIIKPLIDDEKNPELKSLLERLFQLYRGELSSITEVNEFFLMLSQSEPFKAIFATILQELADACHPEKADAPPFVIDPVTYDFIYAPIPICAHVYSYQTLVNAWQNKEEFFDPMSGVLVENKITFSLPIHLSLRKWHEERGLFCIWEHRAQDNGSPAWDKVQKFRQVYFPNPSVAPEDTIKEKIRNALDLIMDQREGSKEDMDICCCLCCFCLGISCLPCWISMSRFRHAEISCLAELINHVEQAEDDETAILSVQEVINSTTHQELKNDLIKLLTNLDAIMDDEAAPFLQARAMGT